MDERLVAVEEAVPARQQVALEPALAEVLGQDLHHAAVGREVLVGRAASRRSRPGPSPRTRRRAGSTRSRPGPKSRKLSGFAAITSRRNAPSTRVASLVRRAGLRHVDRVVAEVGQDEVAQQQAAVRVRVRAHPALALRRQRRRAPGRACRARRRAPPAGSCAATPRARAGAPGCRARRRAAPGASARCPRPAGRRPPSAPSSPSACAARSSASAAASTRLAARRGRASWMRGDLVERGVERGREALVDGGRLLAVEAAVTRTAGSRSPRAATTSSASGIRASTVGFAIL